MAPGSYPTALDVLRILEAGRSPDAEEVAGLERLVIGKNEKSPSFSKKGSIAR
jgi:hypothetical protein